MTNISTVDADELNKFAALSQEWWDEAGALKTLHDINPARMAFIQQHTALADKRVLDIGCGGGILAEALAKQKAIVCALDAEPEAIVIAKQHAAAAHLSIDYQHAYLEEYEASPFDVITCMEMLEHVPKPEPIIEHAVRLLKPGGYLFLSTINRNLAAYASAIVAAEYILKLLPRQTHDFAKFIKPAELAAITRKYGLETLALTGMSYNPFTRVADLCDSVGVNYLMCCRKP